LISGSDQHFSLLLEVGDLQSPAIDSLLWEVFPFLDVNQTRLAAIVQLSSRGDWKALLSGSSANFSFYYNLEVILQLITEEAA